MKVRTPKLDFSRTPARWSANPEFAQSMNASSLWIPHLERFLNRVVAKAITTLGDDDRSRELRGEGRLFIRQEANHYTLHGSFNEILKREGYDVEAFEERFAAEFEELLATKSLAFLCAYCEGFETMGPPAALVWLDEIEDLLVGADPEVVKLWKWHLMEEYEHRTVCHDLFHEVHGGYFLRIYGFFYQLRHLQGFSKMVREHLLGVDRSKMTPEQVAQSKRREKQASRKIMMLALPRLLKVLSPFYSPRKAREPKSFAQYRQFVEQELI